MRILVLGAGGVGGYFGGRLVEKGEDVTFLVRSGRQQQIQQCGLVIRSIHGDLTIHPKTITAESPSEVYDLVILSSKAYHLGQAIEDLRPFVGEETVILPLLNGVAHYKLLQDAFGEDRVIGGLCFIETTLNQEGHIVQTSRDHYVRFGEFDNKDTQRIQQLEEVLGGTKTSFKRSSFIEQDIWRKYLFISTISGVTTLMRAPMGPILESRGGAEFVHRVFLEIESIMRAHGAPLDQDIVSKHMETMRKMGYEMKSSMQRDMEKRLSVEADHLQGYLLQLAENYDIQAPLLRTIYQNLLVYQVSLQLILGHNVD